MKKLISIALVVIMLFSMIPATISAKTFYSGEANVENNVVDGKVNEGEYSWTSGSYDRKTTVPNQFYVATAHTDSVALTSQWWMEFDEEYIYVAYKERGHQSTGQTVGWIDLNPNPNETAQLSLYYIFNKAEVGQNETKTAFNEFNVFEYTADDTSTEANASDYVEAKAGSWYDDGERAVFTVEFKIKRSALADYAGIESFDKIGFRGVTQSNDGEAFYADADSSSKVFGLHKDKGYHIILEGPEPEPVAVTKVVVDGKVKDDEYKWTSGSYDRNTNVDNKFYVAEAHTDSVALTSQWWLDWDENYIYVAYKERGHVATGQTVGWIDLNPNPDETAQLSLYYVFEWAGLAQNTTKTAFNEFYVFEYTADDTRTQAVASDYVTAKAGSWYDDGWRALCTVEFKIKRSALAVYAGIDSFETIGFRGVTQSHNGEAFYADKDSSSKVFGLHKDKGYHILDVTPCEHNLGDWFEVTPVSCGVDGEYNRVCSKCEGIERKYTPATGDHDYEKVGISSTQHADVCTVCGDTTNAEDHVDTNEIAAAHTYWSPAHTIIECSVCPEYAVYEDPIDGHLFNACGQLHIFRSATKAAPSVDGTVLNNEYSWSLKGVNPNNLPAGTSVSKAEIEGLENVNFYVSYDETRVYLAMEVTDKTQYEKYVNAAYFSVGSGNMTDAYRFYLTAENRYGYECWKVTENAPSAIKPGNKAIASCKKFGGNFVYEIALDRETFELNGGAIYVAMAVQTSDGCLAFGTNQVEIEGYDKLSMGANIPVYPNVLFFGTMEDSAEYIQSLGVAPPECDHEAVECISISSTEHQYVCFCGVTEKTEHSFVYTQNDDKSHTSDCDDCGAKFNEVHKTAEVIDTNELVHVTACVCGAEISSEHIYGMPKVVESATHTKAGKGEKACLVCDYKVAVDIPATAAHNYAAWTNDGDTHTSVCACGETVTEAHNYVDNECSVCRAVKAAAPTEDAPNADGADDTTTASGCKATVAAFAVALVAMLGTCTVFVAKKKD